MKAVLDRDASAVRTYADDVLRGDFSSFPELEKLKRLMVEDGGR
jgi:hypothetical protein